MALNGLAVFGRTCILTMNTFFLILALAVTVIGGLTMFAPDVINDVIEKLVEMLMGMTGGMADLDLSTIDMEAMTGDADIWLLVGGVCFIAMTGIAIFASKKKVFCLLILYGILLLLVIGGEIFAGWMFFKSSMEISESIRSGLQNMLLTQFVGGNSSDIVTVAMNFLMVNLQCCGINDFSDFNTSEVWNRNRTDESVSNFTFILMTPLACCKDQSIINSSLDVVDCALYPTKDNSYYNIGCYNLLLTYLEKYIGVAYGLISAVGLFEVCLCFFAFWLASASKKEKKEKEEQSDEDDDEGEVDGNENEVEESNTTNEPAVTDEGQKDSAETIQSYKQSVKENNVVKKQPKATTAEKKQSKSVAGPKKQTKPAKKTSDSALSIIATLLSKLHSDKSSSNSNNASSSNVQQFTPVQVMQPMQPMIGNQHYGMMPMNYQPPMCAHAPVPSSSYFGCYQPCNSSPMPASFPVLHPICMPAFSRETSRCVHDDSMTSSLSGGGSASPPPYPGIRRERVCHHQRLEPESRICNSPKQASGKLYDHTSSHSDPSEKTEKSCLEYDLAQEVSVIRSLIQATDQTDSADNSSIAEKKEDHRSSLYRRRNSNDKTQTRLGSRSVSGCVADISTTDASKESTSDIDFKVPQPHKEKNKRPKLENLFKSNTFSSSAHETQIQRDEKVKKNAMQSVRL